MKCEREVKRDWTDLKHVLPLSTFALGKPRIPICLSKMHRAACRDGASRKLSMARVAMSFNGRAWRDMFLLKYFSWTDFAQPECAAGKISVELLCGVCHMTAYDTMFCRQLQGAAKAAKVCCFQSEARTASYHRAIRGHYLRFTRIKEGSCSCALSCSCLYCSLAARYECVHLSFGLSFPTFWSGIVQVLESNSLANAGLAHEGTPSFWCIRKSYTSSRLFYLLAPQQPVLKLFA